MKVRDAGLADLIWLASATGWSGTRQLLTTDAWALFQKWPPIATPLPHDGNTVSQAWTDYGQFVSGGTAVLTQVAGSPALPNTILMEVVARGGLNLRRGPGENYAVEQTLPLGTVVHALNRHGDWVQVDLEGDGLADGHVHGNYLASVSGGFPILPSTPQMQTVSEPLAAIPLGGRVSPYDIARAELALDVREFPNSANNPRIVMYHRTTNASSGTSDIVPWCSSFVNYCVEQAGWIGTNSQRALTWEDWGQNVGEVLTKKGTSRYLSGLTRVATSHLSSKTSVPISPF